MQLSFVQVHIHSFHLDPITEECIVCEIMWHLFWFESASDEEEPKIAVSNEYSTTDLKRAGY